MGEYVKTDGNVQFLGEGAESRGAIIAMTHDLSGDSEGTHRWRQFVTISDQDGNYLPFKNAFYNYPAANRVLDNGYGKGTEWYNLEQDFSDTPNRVIGGDVGLFKGQPESAYHIYSFETQLVRVSDPAATSGGDILFTLKWGFILGADGTHEIFSELP